jgi:eukaryotic-like serine/threonine-protein kinase
MPDTSPEKLTKIFGQINLSDLPALSVHVQEIISLVGSRKATAEVLSEIILRDFSLTNKIFQLVNSPYYSRTTPISSISRAVTILGFDSVRDIAIAIGLFEEFLKAGLEKEDISMLLAQSFVSAELARAISSLKQLPLSAEESFICTLLHNLGRMIILIYLPDLYREITKRTVAGEKEKDAVPAVLDGLSFQQVGQEIARFWNFSENIIITMAERPSKPRSRNDVTACLQVLVVFCNRIVKSICSGDDISILIDYYGRILGVNRQETIDYMLQSVEKTGSMTAVSSSGLSRLKLRRRLLHMQQNLPGLGPD